jgi:hypothetical protein
VRGNGKTDRGENKISEWRKFKKEETIQRDRECKWVPEKRMKYTLRKIKNSKNKDSGREKKYKITRKEREILDTLKRRRADNL